jgi:hypothetical protein
MALPTPRRRQLPGARLLAAGLRILPLGARRSALGARRRHFHESTTRYDYDQKLLSFCWSAESAASRTRP